MSDGGERVPAAITHLRDRVARDALVTRRDYLRLLVTVSGGLVVGTAAVAAGIFRRHGEGRAAPARVTGALAPGRAVAFAYPTDDDPALAVRLTDGALVGYSSVCTHLACGVIWRSAEGDLYCPCHHGVFEARTGVPVAGPPNRPLPKVELEERPDGIWAVAAGPEEAP
jgi:Rieske Fe-S protein